MCALVYICMEVFCIVIITRVVTAGEEVFLYVVSDLRSVTASPGRGNRRQVRLAVRRLRARKPAVNISQIVYAVSQICA